MRTATSSASASPPSARWPTPTARTAANSTAYYEDIDAGRLPVFRGIELNRDDEIRRDVITRLICHFRLDFADVERRWEIDFHDYFGAASRSSTAWSRRWPAGGRRQRHSRAAEGALLIRNICMAFDAYLEAKQGPVGFSKVI
jgi:oxygen-independent coproporphyrinogen-3 oxidase